MNILIVGHGFVGQAVHYGFSNYPVDVVDPKYGTELPGNGGEDYDVIFVCVPTPMGEEGYCDTSILDSVIDNLKCGSKPLIVIKSTVPPKQISSKYGWRQRVVYNPEFLTERSAAEQFVDPQFHIMGGGKQDCEELAEIYEKHSLCNPCPVHIMTMEQASFVKYAINSFLAMKVTFFNQLFDCVKQRYQEYEPIVKAVGSDKRIGHSHTKVPGFDRKRGYGGACFPKDTSAFIKEFPQLTLLEECVKINNQYRSEYSLDEREKEQHVNYGQTEEEQQDFHNPNPS